MGIEDTYNGATAAMTFFNAYIKTVADEIGMDRAVNLFTKMCETTGAMQGKMMKEQAGTEEIDAKAAWSLVKTVPEGIGISSEVIEESPQEVVVKLSKCPVYTAGQMIGLDAETIETMCRNGSAKLMHTATKELNPNLSYQLRKFRSGPDDFCEEAIVQD
jgi:L-2-amino-thiazoline-4-carboxylic acid hydrolase